MTAAKNVIRALSPREVDAVSGGIVVTKRMDSSSPLLFQEALVGKGGTVSSP